MKSQEIFVFYANNITVRPKGWPEQKEKVRIHISFHPLMETRSEAL